MKNKIYLFIIGVSLSSCASFSTGGIIPPFNYQPNNFNYIKLAGGQHTESYFLGIGGDINGNGLFNTALTNLKFNSDLKSNQSLINIAYDRKKTFIFFPIYWQNKIIITADVIEFYSPNNQDFQKNEKFNSNKLNLELQEENYYDYILELKNNIQKGDKIEVIDSSGTHKGILIRHGDMKYTIKTDQGKIKILKYSKTSLSKID